MLLFVPPVRRSNSFQNGWPPILAGTVSTRENVAFEYVIAIRRQKVDKLYDYTVKRFFLPFPPCAGRSRRRTQKQKFVRHPRSSNSSVARSLQPTMNQDAVVPEGLAEAMRAVLQTPQPSNDREPEGGDPRWTPSLHDS